MEHLFVFLLIRYFGGYTDAQQQLNGELGHPHCLLMLFLFGLDGISCGYCYFYY